MNSRFSRLFLVAGVAAAPALAPGASPTESRAILTADLPRSVSEAIGSQSSDAKTLLDRIAKAAGGTELDLGLVRLAADPRWFAATPPEAPDAPFLELRRWPGDSVIALYALAGSARAGDAPPLPAPEAAPPGARTLGEWRGFIATPSGRRSAAWIETVVPDQERRLGALLIPGDAGLGLDAVPVLLDEMLAMAERVQIRPEAWKFGDVIPTGATIALPRLLAPPARADEIRDVWQSQRVSGYSFGLPPGLRTVQLGSELHAPIPVDHQALWLRGRFVDRDGVLVVIGDGVRAGYVSILRPADGAWGAGERKPLGARSAARAASEDFLAACESTGAVSARAERWTETGFAGDWIVFRLLYANEGVEIGLPVLAGRQSEALFWLPATWRAPGVTPAPPPMDPAARFGISYRPLTKLERAEAPWMEGTLIVPGLRIEVPRGWYAIANLRSADGFPVAFFDGAGRGAGKLIRHPAGSPAVSAESLSEWKALKRASKKSPAAAYGKGAESRLYVTDRGDGLLFDPETGTEKVAWERMIDTVVALRQGPRDLSLGKGSAE